MSIATIVNPKKDDTFKFENETWIIVNVSDFSDKPQVKEILTKRGINASLTVKRLKGKVLYNLPHSIRNTVHEYELTKMS